MSKGKKFDEEKPDLSLLSSKAMVKTAEVMTLSAGGKYEKHNWRKGIEWSRVYAGIQRHLLAWNDGETNDKETGLNHLAHASAGIMFLLEYSEVHRNLDDRHSAKPEEPKEDNTKLVDIERPGATVLISDNLEMKHSCT